MASYFYKVFLFEVMGVSIHMRQIGKLFSSNKIIDLVSLTIHGLVEPIYYLIN